MFFFPRFPSLSSRDVLLIHAKYAKTCSVNLFVCWLQSHEYLVEKREIIMKSNLRLKAKWGITRKESTTDSRWSACCECSLSTASHGLFNICLLKSQRMFVQHLLSIPSSSSFIKGLCLWLFFHGLHSCSSPPTTVHGDRNPKRMCCHKACLDSTIPLLTKVRQSSYLLR